MTSRRDRRSKTEQEIAVLRALKQGAVSRTKILYLSNLNWADTLRHLIHFAKIGFLALRANGFRKTKRRLNHQYIEDLCYLQICITQKGLVFLNQWDEMNKVLED